MQGFRQTISRANARRNQLARALRGLRTSAEATGSATIERTSLDRRDVFRRGEDRRGAGTVNYRLRARIWQDPPDAGVGGAGAGEYVEVLNPSPIAADVRNWCQ